MKHTSIAGAAEMTPQNPNTEWLDKLIDGIYQSGWLDCKEHTEYYSKEAPNNNLEAKQAILEQIADAIDVSLKSRDKAWQQRIKQIEVEARLDELNKVKSALTYTYPEKQRIEFHIDKRLAILTTPKQPKNAPKDVNRYSDPKDDSILPRRDYYDNPAEVHDIPCERCGSKEWTDWLLLPHKLFNEVGGYLCFPCFIKSYPKQPKTEGEG